MPANKPDYMREYMQQYRQAGRDKTRGGRSAARHQPFVGVDGEGGNVPGSDYHAYWLLRAGNARLIPREGNVRLSSRECLDFLCELPRDKQYVVYFGDYDVTKMLEDLPWDRLTRLMDRTARARNDGGIFPLDWHDFEMDYLPRKEFKVRRRGETSWMVINDVGPFFQTSFVEAITKWGVGTSEEVEMIRAEKARRGSFQFSGLAEVDVYNALEIRLLEELMEKFRDACVVAGIVPKKWQGPGLLAEALFQKHGVPQSRDVLLLQDKRYRSLLTFARNAFYGGRPEISVVGPVNREVFQWDINSAYPHAMLSVPCLQHGVWTYSDGPSADGQLPESGNGEASDNGRGVPSRAARMEAFWSGSLEDAQKRHAAIAGMVGQTVERDTAPFALVYGSFAPKPSNRGKYPLWYGLPFRTDKGTITYPGAGRGWYWSFEVAAAIHQDFVVSESWTYHKQCDCQPLGFVAGTYAERQRIGKDGPGIILKLAMNSLYGKTVQSIGFPKYANAIWGSFVTAYCRTMVQDFIHGSEWCKDEEKWCGYDVVMVATDSVCTLTERTDIIESTTLGGWSREIHAGGMFIVQPGLYFGTSGKRAKTRGVPLAVITEKEAEFRAAFDRMAESRRLADGDVRVPQRLFAGIRYTLHRHNTKLLGQWIEFKEKGTGVEGKAIRFDWSSKRARYPVLDPIPGERDYILTFPLEGSTAEETVPYSKDIGGLLAREEARIQFLDQPDWVQPIGLEEA